MNRDDAFPDRSLERFVATGARRVRRNRLALLAPWLIDLAVVLLAAILRQPLVLLGLIHGSVAGLVLTAYAYQRNPWPKLEDAEVVADAQGVWVGGKLELPRAEIKQGFVYEQSGVWRVRLSRGRLSDEIEVPDEATGRGLLRALGLDASQTVAEFRVASPFFSWSTPRRMATILGPMAGLVALGAMAGAIVGKAAAPFAFVGGELLLLIGLIFLFFPARLFIGRDGILHRWLGRETFHPIATIRSVSPCVSSGTRNAYVGAEVELEQRAPVRFLVGQRKWNDAQQAMLVDRIDQVLKGRERSGAIPFEASALRRGGRDVGAWVQALRALGAGARDDLRSVPADLERLLELIEDASASPLDRAAAAVALPASLPQPERERLRITAAATAEPRLRIALEKVANGETEDEAVIESLAELDAQAAASVTEAKQVTS